MPDCIENDVNRLYLAAFAPRMPLPAYQLAAMPMAVPVLLIAVATTSSQTFVAANRKTNYSQITTAVWL